MNKTIPRILLPIFLLICGVSIIALSFTSLNKSSDNNLTSSNKKNYSNIVNNDEPATKEYQVGDYTVTEYLADDTNEYIEQSNDSKFSPQNVVTSISENLVPLNIQETTMSEVTMSRVTVESEANTVMYYIKANVRPNDINASELLKLERNVADATNSIYIDIPLNYEGEIEVAVMYLDGRASEFRTWSNLTFDQETMLLDVNSPSLQTSPSQETANKIPLIIAIDQQVNFLVGKETKAVMLRTVKKDGTEIVIDDMTQYPFRAIISSQNKRSFFSFNLSWNDPSFTIDKVAYYELTIQNQDGTIETYTYDQSVDGVYVKMPEVSDVTQGYVFYEEYPGAWFGEYDAFDTPVDRTGKLYFINWYSFSKLRTNDSLYSTYPTVFRENSITITPRTNGYIANDWYGDILMGEVEIYGTGRALNNNYIYVPNSENVVPQIILDEIIAYLSNQYSVPYDQIYLDSIEAVTWADSCMTNPLNEEPSSQSRTILGIVSPNCAQVLTEGYRLIFKAEWDNFEFSAEIHSNEDFSIWRVHEATLLSYQEIITYLSNEYNIPEENITLSSYESVWWRDGCLELGEPGERCTTVVTPGYLLTFTSNYLGEERTFIIHTNESLSMWRENKSTNPYQEIISYISNEYNIPEENIVLESRQQVNWRDGCLELGEPRERCTTVVTPGYLLTFTSNYLGEERIFTIHANESLSIWKENKAGSILPVNPGEVM